MLAADWHIHSRNSCDCRDGALATSMADTVAAIEAAGIRDYGITDHLHTQFNLPDIVASRREFVSLPPSAHRHFGIEVSSVSQWEFEEIATGRYEATVYGLRDEVPPHAEPAIALTKPDIDTFGIEYVVAGTHWLLNVPVEREAVIRDYHRQNMFLACHPLVTIVAHPWWWNGQWQEADGSYRGDPWFDDFRKVPQSMHDEFAAAAREHATVVEINLHGMLLCEYYPITFRRQYCEYLAGLQAAGVTLSIGSDHHAQLHGYAENIGRTITNGRPSMSAFETAMSMLAAVSIHDYDLWRFPATSSPQ